MSKVKTDKATGPSGDDRKNTQITSVIFGLVMVAAVIVAGAALLGGTLPAAGQRWSNAVDNVLRVAGFSVVRIEITGLEHIPDTMRQVGQATMIAPGDNMFDVDPNLVRRRLEATLLVTNVRVYRMWPDTIVIHADAVEPVALWHDGQKWYVIDSLGRKMPTVQASAQSHLFKSVGAGAPEALPHLDKAFSSIPDLFAQVNYVRRIARNRWNLVLNSGMVIKMPGDENLLSGLSRLAKIDEKGRLTQRSLAVIDMRVPGHVFLTVRTADATGTAT